MHVFNITLMCIIMSWFFTQKFNLLKIYCLIHQPAKFRISPNSSEREDAQVTQGQITFQHGGKILSRLFRLHHNQLQVWLVL